MTAVGVVWESRGLVIETKQEIFTNDLSPTPSNKLS